MAREPNPIIGRVKCGTCGAANLLRVSDNGDGFPYHVCTECSSQHFARGPKSAGLMRSAMTPLDAPKAAPPANVPADQVKPSAAPAAASAPTKPVKESREEKKAPAAAGKPAAVPAAKPAAAGARRGIW